MSEKQDDKVRLDKWLWAARFYKTRALAKEAIEGGKVHCQGERCKPGKEPKVGDELSIRQGFVGEDGLIAQVDNRLEGKGEIKIQILARLAARAGAG